ncbi:MAG: hypothetical protein ABIV48_03000 [Pyrinomonadaceae bacterium]
MKSTLVAALKLGIMMSSISSIMASLSLGQEVTDPDSALKIVRPAYIKNHPKVLFDEAHFNVHTSGGRYKRFADLITNDGYRVIPNGEKFQEKTLKGYDILVIVSALGANRDTNPQEAGDSAFTEGECDAVRDWVRRGGRLLLVADHEPMGAAAQNLAGRFAVDLRNGSTMESSPKNHLIGCPGCIFFTRANGLLGEHPITRGRDMSERVPGVMTGVGLSLKGPDGTTVILKLADTVFDQLPSGEKIPAAGRAQGIAFKFGKGRVVVIGEAAVISGQATGRPGFKIDRWGRHHPGIDGRQFALNIMHWLSGLLN